MYQDKRRRAALAIALTVLMIAGSRPSAQSRPLVAPEAAVICRRLLPQISRIKIFDHHAHPGFADDQEVDPAPVPAGALPLRLSPENPDWAAATRALFGVTSKARLKALNPGAKYFDAILDRLGIETSATGSFLMYPNQFKDVLERWFEIMPGKVTFGAEELYWFGVHNARTAAAAALAEMVAAREITEPQTMTIARGYLHDNAAALYR